MRVVVVGAGIVGLTCALRLAQDGHDVHVLARDLPLETTSSVAAALWYPYRAEPLDRVGRWAAQTYDEQARLAATEPAAGVTMRAGRELRRTPGPDPFWREDVRGFARLAPPDLPPGYVDGWRFLAPVADTSVHLPWLVARLEALGGTVTRAALPALPAGGEVVVNCSGLAARRLAGDPTVRPVRGQVLVLAPPEGGLEEWLLDQSDGDRPTYVVPRTHDVVVGGIAQEGAWDRDADPVLARDILARASALVPQLARARVLAHRVGLRPARPAVRLEVEDTGGRPVVHCYGHGGAGVTLAWGCAGEVVDLVRALQPTTR